ncbi:restriction endonuclease subunit S [Motiliproteus sp. MSK22-1]|uniref:restriction endonuclease subunit S n=1 Tax=Motiliproteus sp. MSK22-1 TaxID=1897630 RepID=UPI000978C62D|nr:restriction endonuclease subunit S [Motiliproteus sp. MSK22-1]OMH27841.1 hypothetical protein BGP75_22465 [Motiliproteus sp. MSK22-1]
MIFNSSRYNGNWQDKKLSELGEFRRGKSRHRPRNDPKLFENGTYPLVQTGEVKSADLYIRTHEACYNDFGLAQSAIWPENTLCITIAANIAETALLGYPMCFPDSIVGFNADKDESSELFMHYVFTYIRKAIQNSASGSIQDNINIDYLTGLNFKIPDKPYQDKVVKVLSLIDNKIELNQRINNELMAMAKSLYQYWFVQYDFPDANGNPYKTSGGKMVYNPSLKREIPKGWGVSFLSEFMNCNANKLGKNHDLEEIKYLDTASLTENVVGDLQNLKFGRDNIPSRANMVVKENDILYSTVRPNQLHHGIIKQPTKNMIASTGYAVLSHKSDSLLNVFFYLCIIAEENIQKLIKISESSKSSYPSISPEDVLNIKMALPKESCLLVKLSKLLNPIFEKMSENQLENKELSRHRDWLLPMLMNGQVTVK